MKPISRAGLLSAINAALWQADWDAEVARQWLAHPKRATCPIFSGAALCNAIAALRDARAALASAEQCVSALSATSALKLSGKKARR